MRWIFILAVLILSCNEQKPASSLSQTLAEGKWIDLTYSFSSASLYWPTAELFRLDTAFEGITEEGYYYSSYNFCASEHGGTHLDAPVKGGSGGPLRIMAWIKN